MLTKRIIPCLDIKDGRVVKGVSFSNLKDAGDPVELAKFYEKEGADELVFLDITATSDKRKTAVDLASKVAKEISIPFTIGGGIKSIEDIREILKAGADKVSIESASVLNPDLVSEASKYFGSQAICVSVSPKRTESRELRVEMEKLKNNSTKLLSSQFSALSSSQWTVWIKGGRENTGIDLIEFLKNMQNRGAGEILLNSIDEDGRNQGYDLEMLRATSEVLNIPLIASSGAGELEHFYDGIMAGSDAVLAASVFHTKKFRISEVKEYLKGKNIDVRI